MPCVAPGFLVCASPCKLRYFRRELAAHGRFHWPLCASLVLASAASGEMMKEDDVVTGLEWCASRLRSFEPLLTSRYWGCGLGFALFFLVLIDITHRDLSPWTDARIPRVRRCANRIFRRDMWYMGAEPLTAGRKDRYLAVRRARADPLPARRRTPRLDVVVRHCSGNQLVRIDRAGRGHAAPAVGCEGMGGGRAGGWRTGSRGG